MPRPDETEPDGLFLRFLRYWADAAAHKTDPSTYYMGLRPNCNLTSAFFLPSESHDTSIVKLVCIHSRLLSSRFINNVDSHRCRQQHLACRARKGAPRAGESHHGIHPVSHCFSRSSGCYCSHSAQRHHCRATPSLSACLLPHLSSALLPLDTSPASTNLWHLQGDLHHPFTWLSFPISCPCWLAFPTPCQLDCLQPFSLEAKGTYANDSYSSRSSKAGEVEPFPKHEGCYL